MSNAVISEFHWNMILDAVYGGSCVPFLGAAVNISNDVRGYKGLPLGGDVALRLIESLIGSKIDTADDLAKVTNISEALKNAGLDQDLARLNFQNLPRVALHFEVESLLSRAYLLQRLRALLPDDECEPSQILETVAQLPFNLIVTTNYDRLLERALDSAVEESLSISVADLKDPQALAMELKEETNPLSQYLLSKLGPGTRQLLQGYDGLVPASEALKSGLADELNRLLNSEDLYEEHRFAQVTLTDEIHELIAGNPEGEKRLLLNRLLLEEAYVFELAKSRKPYKVVVQPIDGFKGPDQNKQMTKPPAENVPVVYKIHGSFHGSGTDPMSGVIITEEDYIKFLTIVGRPGEGVPTYVSSKMVRSTLLFIGYSLEDWDFRTIYKGLIEPLTNDEKRTSFAIQWGAPAFWKKYWQQKGIVIYDYDVYQFAEDLEKRYVEKYGNLRATKQR